MDLVFNELFKEGYYCIEEKEGEMQRREKEIELSQGNCLTAIMGIHTAYVFKEVKVKIDHMHVHMQTYWDSL